MANFRKLSDTISAFRLEQGKISFIIVILLVLWWIARIFYVLRRSVSSCELAEIWHWPLISFQAHRITATLIHGASRDAGWGSRTDRTLTLLDRVGALDVERLHYVQITAYAGGETAWVGPGKDWGRSLWEAFVYWANALFLKLRRADHVVTLLRLVEEVVVSCFLILFE